MKRSRFTEEQVTYALKLAEQGTPVKGVCRQFGIVEARFQVRWKKYAGLGPTEVRELRQLRKENSRLEKLVADLTLDKQILTGVVQKSSEASAAPRAGDLDTCGFQGIQGAGLPAGVTKLVHVLPQASGTAAA